MASRDELIKNIHSDMMLNKAFFLKVYGYEISSPGFADKAIKTLNKAGCSRAREYYEKIVSEYEKKHEEELKKAAVRYYNKCEKRGEIKRKQEQEILQQMSNSDLIMLLENLTSVT